MNDPVQPTSPPVAAAPAPAFATAIQAKGKRWTRRLIIVAVVIMAVGVVSRLGGGNAASSHITKTLDEFREASTQDLHGDPDESGTNDKGNKFYSWNREYVSTTLIADGSTPRITQVNVVSARASNEVDVKDRLVINAVGPMQVRQMIQAANNGGKDYKRFDDVFIWLGENYDKSGAKRVVGNITVAVSNVVVKDNITFTVFSIY